MLNCFGRVLKRSLSAHLVQVKLLLVSFYLHGGWHVVTIRKPSEQMSNFWMVWFSKPNPNHISVFRTSLIITEIPICSWFFCML